MKKKLFVDFLVDHGEVFYLAAVVADEQQYFLFQLLPVRKGARAAEEEHGSGVTPLPQIEEAIISFINDNENKGKITYLGEIGSRLNAKFTDFDVRNYGYTKLVVFLQDTCPVFPVFYIFTL